MPWLISGILCFGLVVAVGAVVFPDLVMPVLAKIWDLAAHFSRNE